MITKSDPCCIVYEMQDEKWVKVGQTETINNNLNPDFGTSVKIRYKFSEMQKLKFEINDADVGGKQDLIGSKETTVGSILHAKNSTWMDRLEFQGSEKHRGVIIVRAENITE